MSIDPDPDPDPHPDPTLRSPVGPTQTGRTSGLTPTTGDDGVDEILVDFASVGAEPPQAQVEAAEEAHRRLQARLSSP